MEFIYVIINSTDNNLIFLVSILGICQILIALLTIFIICKKSSISLDYK